MVEAALRQRIDGLAAAGRYGQAVGVLRNALRDAPPEAEIHYRLGGLLADWEQAELISGEVHEPFRLKFPWGEFPFPIRDHYTGRKIPDAVAHLRTALKLDPGHPGALALLALLLVLEAATVREGAGLAQRAVVEARQDHRAHLAMAILGLRQGAWAVALAAAAQADRLSPGAPEAGAIRRFAETAPGDGGPEPSFSEFGAEPLVFLAGQLALGAEAGGFSDPVREAAAGAVHALAARLLDLAEQALLETQAVVYAARCLDHARRLEPDSGGAARVAGILLFKNGAFDDAARALSYALNSAPRDARAQQYLMLARFGGAPDARSAGAGIDDLSVDDLLDLAETLAAQLKFEKAAALSAKALDQDPDSMTASLLHAQLCALLGDVDAAAETLEQARRRQPQSAEIEGDLANVYLAQARLAEAWPLYESRLRRRRGSTPRTVPDMPQWNGAPLEGGRVLIWREEGIGDEIRFSSCLPDALSRLSGDVTYDCDPRLQSLYARSFPDIRVRPEDLDRNDAGRFDVHMPVGSLPGMFRQTLEDFPPDAAFLTADPDRVAVWRRRLDEIGSGPKIGIGWRSLNAGWHKRPLHSRLADWRPIAEIAGVRLISLQCGARAGEIEAAETGLEVPIHQFRNLDLNNDMENVAALMTALDAIVACQCWLLHLGGALGAKVYTFNARPNPYFMGQETNPWAPTVEVVYREPGRDWRGPMMEIASRLRRRFGLQTDQRNDRRGR